MCDLRQTSLPPQRNRGLPALIACIPPPVFGCEEFHSLLDTGIAKSPQIPNARLGATLTRQAVIDAATRQYMAGQSLDMFALAAELGIGRSTLYRIVGNRENLVGTLLAQATERTFRRATTYTTAEGGLEHLLVLNRFMHAIVTAGPLRTPRQDRDPAAGS